MWDDHEGNVAAHLGVPDEVITINATTFPKDCSALSERAWYASLKEHPQRTSCPSDVTDEEWAIVSPYLVLMSEDVPQWTHELRDAFNVVRWIVPTDAP